MLCLVTNTTQSNTSNNEARNTRELDYFFPRLVVMGLTPPQHPLMPDDHSELVPPLPIPNRTVKRLHANDSADTRVKVGNRQAPHLLLAS
jgi:hypothetical protein